MESKQTPECSNTREQVCQTVPELCPSNPDVLINITEFFQSIPELFKGKCVLVTGATGFVGKVLVEKLLRSCPEIKEVYILLRASSEIDVIKKLEDFLGRPVFDTLRTDGSHPLQKIKGLTGDITKDNIGLNKWQCRKIISDISFVFHCAANDRFDDEPLNTMNANLLGVKNILDMCKSCERLEALVHVSSAFPLGSYSETCEQIYPEQPDPQQIIEALRWMTNDELRTLCMNYIKGRHTMYHFSKALAETLVVQYESLPVIIVRPSTITASVKEPFPGWIDTYNGPTEFIAECGQGINRALLVKDYVKANWVPVDIVANTLIAAAYYMAVKSKWKNYPLKLDAPSRVPIIYCTCPITNLITWTRLIEICLPFLIQYPSTNVYGKPGCYVTDCPLKYNMYRMMCHYIPAILFDGATCLTLKKPRMVCHYKRIHRSMRHLEYYTTHNFYFHSTNMRLLALQMSPEDNELFPIDQSTLDWRAYMENYVLGVRRYFLNETNETLPEARVRMMRIHYIWLTCKLHFMLGIFLLITSMMRVSTFSPTSHMQTISYVIALFQSKLLTYCCNK